MPILLPGEFSENIRIYVVEAKERKQPLSSEINAFQEKTVVLGKFTVSRSNFRTTEYSICMFVELIIVMWLQCDDTLLFTL